MHNTVTFTREKRDALRRAYDAATHANVEQFMFEGHVLLVAYAKYLLEYLDRKLGK